MDFSDGSWCVIVVWYQFCISIVVECGSSGSVGQVDQVRSPQSKPLESTRFKSSIDIMKMPTFSTNIVSQGSHF